MNLARTVGRGHTEVVGSTGGPLIAVGDAVFPAPRGQLGVRHGATDDLDVMGRVSIDGLLSAFLAVDVGLVAQMLREPAGFAMSFSARVHAVIDLDDLVVPRVFPEFGLHLEHPLSPTFWLFFGLGALVQFDPPQGRPFLFASPYLGLEARFDPVTDANGTPTDQTAISLQLGWINPWEPATSIVRFVPDGAGAFTVVLALRHQFGGIGR